MDTPAYDQMFDERAELYSQLEAAQERVRQIKQDIRRYDKAIKALGATSSED